MSLEAQLAQQLTWLQLGRISCDKLLSFVPSSGPMVAVIQSIYDVPRYHLLIEVILVICIVWLLSKKSYKLDEKSPPIDLTDEEIDAMVAEWQPEPMVPAVPAAKNLPLITGPIGKNVQVGDKNVLNFATFNFLGFVENKRITDAATATVRKYGVGSCGPRGFYGTIDVHLQLEEKLAAFTKTEEAVLYSYGFSTIASVIPAYAKRGDILFVDAGISFPVQQGVEASRSVVKYFKHNDVKDLERLLIEQHSMDLRNPKQAKTVRKFIVVEGLYPYFGDIAPLRQIIDLKWKYKVRIVLDESYSFGVLGKSGRGITEHFGVSNDDIDIHTASMEYALGSVGGFSFGKSFVVDHQRLSAQGYCFSASLPPLLASAASVALDIMQESPDLFTALRTNANLAYNVFQKQLDDYFIVRGTADSPLIHLSLKHASNRTADQALLERIVDAALSDGILFTCATYIEAFDRCMPEPSIRVVVSATHTKEEIEKAAAVLERASASVLAPS